MGYKLRNIIVCAMVVSLMASSSMMFFAAFGQEEISRNESVIINCTAHVTTEHYNPYNPSYQRQKGDYVVCWEALMYMNAYNGSLYGWLATGYEYSNNYTILKWHVRPGVKFWDGHPFTARDIAYTLKMVMFDKACNWQTIVRNVADVYTEDDNMTCVIRFSQPMPTAWISYINPQYDCPTWMPEYIFSQKVNTGQPGGENLTMPSKYAPTAVNTEWAATGVYIFDRVTADLSTHIYKRWDDYWGQNTFGLPGPKYAVFKEQTDVTARLMAMMNNDLDASMDIGWTDFLHAKDYNPSLDFCKGPDVHPRTLYVNLERYPLNYSSVRWAIAHAIDQQKLQDMPPLEGNSKLGTLPLPDFVNLRQYLPDDVGPGKKYNTAAYNTTEIQVALAQVGCTKGDDGLWRDPNGTKLSFTMYGFSFAQAYNTAVSQMLAAIGFEISFKTLGTVETYAIMLGGNWDFISAYQFGVSNPIEPLTYFYSHLYSGHGELVQPRGVSQGGYFGTNGNWERWSNDTFDTIVEQTVTLPKDDSQFIANCKQMYDIFFENLPFIPLNQVQHWSIFNTKYWTNWPGGISQCNGSIVNGKLVNYDFTQLKGAWHSNMNIFYPNLFRLQATGTEEPSGQAGLEWWHYAVIGAVAIAVVGSVAGYWIRKRRK